MTQTQTQNDGSQTQATKQNSIAARDVYDMLMMDIEPDLMTDALPLLDAKYANETADEKKARKERYKVAYKKFDQVFAEFMNEIESSARATEREAFRKKEAASRTEEAEMLNSLTSAFQ